MSANVIEDLARDPSLVILSAMPASTDSLAERVLVECGGSLSVVAVLRRYGFLVESKREWRLHRSLRERAIDRGVHHQADLWRDAHDFLRSESMQANESSLPSYLVSGPGHAFHTTELHAKMGEEAYRGLAHIDSAAVSVQSLKLAAEQGARGLLDMETPVFLFLAGMTAYRTGRKVEAIQVLRSVANSDESSREVAVAKHLVGHWDCLKNKDGRLDEAQELLLSSHRIGASLHDSQHLAHVKHSMALCMLKSQGNTRNETAVALLRESLQILQQIGDEFGRAKVLHSLGQALGKHRGEAASAKAYLAESLAIGRRLGYEYHVRSVEASIEALGTPARTGRVRKGPRRPSR